MKKLLSALFALALCSSMALATVPYPPNCVVAPCDGLLGVVWCPDNPTPISNSVVTLTIRNQANNPIANAAVNVTIGAGPTCTCASMVFNTTTNAQGVATLTLRGGGCIRNTDLACVFRANGVVVRDFQNLKSPDWDGASGNCTVNLADLVRYALGTDLCFDFNNTGAVDLGDLVIFVSGYTPSHHCP
jgi:hypothetical protein